MSGTVIETQVDAKSGDFAQNSRRMVDRLTRSLAEEAPSEVGEPVAVG